MKKFHVPSSGFRKILIVKPSAFGDVIHGLPVLQALSERFPEAELHWVVARQFAGILKDHPLIHRLWVIDKDGWKRPGRFGRTCSELGKLRRGLREEKFDLVIDLQGLFRSALIVLFTGARETVGFESAREGARFFYKYRVRTEPELHAVEKNLLIARFVGCKEAAAQFPLADPGEVPEIVRGLGRYAVIAPSAGTLVKRWPAEYFGRLASLLSVPSVVVAGGSDVALGEKIASLSGGRAVSLAGKTSLQGLCAVIKGAQFLVTCDSGPMHLAAALKVPVFSLFGPTSPVRTGPYGSIHTVLRLDLACSPCYTRKPCPDWRCLLEITPEMVLEAIGSKGF
ncbi:MAG: lipopolysaccharide heptosyltransferase I [Syntrophobacteraceae bacterium]|nr:lipopolysaccharide heptosyltransferase I [Syntrophobacteraceae bacterium]